jgi:hypothetical protein
MGSSLIESLYDSIQKRPQALLPAADHHLDCALITASRPLPEEVQEEARAQEAINASQILTPQKSLSLENKKS